MCQLPFKGKLFDRKKRPFVFTYLDDILITSKTVEEHFQHMSVVFTKLMKVGLKIRPEKCCFNNWDTL